MEGFRLPALSQLSRKVLTLPVQSGGTILVAEFGVNGIRGESLCKNVDDCAKQDSGEGVFWGAQIAILHALDLLRTHYVEVLRVPIRIGALRMTSYFIQAKKIANANRDEKLFSLYKRKLDARPNRSRQVPR